jgi:hypothetical protein
LAGPFHGKGGSSWRHGGPLAFYAAVNLGKMEAAYVTLEAAGAAQDPIAPAASVSAR